MIKFKVIHDILFSPFKKGDFLRFCKYYKNKIFSKSLKSHLKVSCNNKINKINKIKERIKNIYTLFDFLLFYFFVNFEMFQYCSSSPFGYPRRESFDKMKPLFKLPFLKHMNGLIRNDFTFFLKFFSDIRNQIHIRKNILTKTILRKYKNLVNHIFGNYCNIISFAQFKIIFKEVITKYYIIIRHSDFKHFRIPDIKLKFIFELSKAPVDEFTVKNRCCFYVIFWFHVKHSKYILTKIINYDFKYKKLLLSSKINYYYLLTQFSTNVDYFFNVVPFSPSYK